MNTPPDFIIIGAMKCATSTLHEQLALQPGFFMTALKEPNYFSDDDQYARGRDWYLSLFADARTGDLRGESSTHYTKLPTYPQTLDRLRDHCPDPKLIYVMRHPIDRLISQYVHEWSQLVIPNQMGIDEALDAHPELIAYSCYAMQLRPYFEAFGSDRILPVFFERIASSPQAELERICEFLGYPHDPSWHHDLHARNVSNQRMRKNALRDAIVEAPVLRQLRRALVPKAVRTWVRGLWTLKQKPRLSPRQLARLVDLFNDDLATLGSWLGVPLSCPTFKDTVKAGGLEWKAAPSPLPRSSIASAVVESPSGSDHSSQA
ncbi:sulfotransferase family protein [Tautonia rosea]|uniref:sulfotransferase family protein n=1 Tax=Tautonia rosea TaxID=2728037 RepID=UPI0014763D06|nr:sulfotransferase [Tautonia rosea]